MTDTIIVALIAFGGTSLGSVCGVLVSSKLTNYRIEQLEKRVTIHNNLIDRTYKVEEKQAIQDEQIKVVNHRIEDLERVS